MSASDMDKLLKAIDRRLNSGPEKLARVRKLDDGRFEVALLRRNDADRQRVERLLAEPGHAGVPHPGQQSSRQGPYRASPERPVQGRGARSLRQEIGLVGAGEGRARKRASQAMPTLSGARRSRTIATLPKSSSLPTPATSPAPTLPRPRPTDNRGNTDLNFTLNEAGGKLFAKLTGDHLPDTSTVFPYRLGIILDGGLSAPRYLGHNFQPRCNHGLVQQRAGCRPGVHLKCRRKPQTGVNARAWRPFERNTNDAYPTSDFRRSFDFRGPHPL